MRGRGSSEQMAALAAATEAPFDKSSSLR